MKEKNKEMFNVQESFDKGKRYKENLISFQF